MSRDENISQKKKSISGVSLGLIKSNMKPTISDKH